MVEEIVDIVDENDTIIGKATREEAHRKNLLHRLVHIVVENVKGEILVLTRASSMEVWPGWYSNVGGHVNLNESYENAALRELFEEIGVRGKLEPFGKVMVANGKYSHMTGCFKVKSDGPFKPDRLEISKMEFKSLEKIGGEISVGRKYTPTFRKVIGQVYGGKVEEETVDLVNERDEVIGKATRAEVKSRKLLYRCAGVYAEIGGKLAIEKRSPKKSVRPGNWSIVEETVHSGENYEQAARRGVKEELGLNVKELRFIGRKLIEDYLYPDKFMLSVFTCKTRGKMRLQESEVEEVKLMSAEEVSSFLGREKKVSPGLAQTFEMYREAVH